MTRLTVSVEEDVLEKVQEELGTGSKAETVRRALEEVLRRKRLAEVLEHQGKIDLDLDQDELQELRDQG